MRRAILLLIALLGWPVWASAQNYTVTPSPFLTVFNNSGTIVSGGCVWTYLAGTTTAATTYSDSAGTLNANPIIADTAGRFTAYLTPGTSYKFVYENTPCSASSHGTTLRTADNIGAVPVSGLNVDETVTAGQTVASGDVVYVSDGSGGNTAGYIYQADADFVYASSGALQVGIATSAITSGSSGTIRVLGRVTGLSGLVAGTRYYASATAGALTATAPLNGRFVGVADTTTSLMVNANLAVPGGYTQWTTSTPLEIAEGRLTLTSGSPVTTGDVTGAATVYYAPYKGNRIALYDGSTNWNIRSFSQITIDISMCTASKPYDVFLYDNAGTVTAEILVWTNSTTRATALTTQDGVYVKTGATTRRYVGSFYCNASGGQTDDSLTKRDVWNYYNRVPRAMRRVESTANWTYTTATYREANNNTANQFDVMIGVAEVDIRVQVMGSFSNTNTAVIVESAVGEDSTAAPATECIIGYQYTVVANAIGQMIGTLEKFPTAGRHTYVWLEFSAATGTTTWYGSTTTGSGLTGVIWG